MKASDYIASFLAANGVTVVFELTGGMVTHLLDSLGSHPDIRVVSMHHEQAAAFAAEGVARMTGVPGVALATSGPGATNLITGIGSCFFDSVPAVFITGQVNTDELRADSGVRQAGFQETDIVSIATPITKSARRVDSAADLPNALADAFRLALEGRPGPVLLDIPMNVQRTDVEGSPARVAHPPAQAPDEASVERALDVLSRAERPLILAGGGVDAARASAALRTFAEATGVPVAATLMALDVLPADHSLRVGFIGTYGNRWANLALRDADCVLVLGARLDVRQTGAAADAFRAGKTIVRVDIDEAQLVWRIEADQRIRADVGAFLACAAEAAGSRSWPRRDMWLESIAAHRREWPQDRELADMPGIDPLSLLGAISTCVPDASAFVTDVGQNQMWAAQSVVVGDGQRFLTSGGMGSMGFALPAAIGAAIALPSRPVVAIAGDGGLQVNIQELETVSRLGLPIKIVVLDNGCLGMVRQFQDEYFDSRYQSTLWGYGAPDFVAVSEAYGISARSVSKAEGVDDAISWLLDDPASPALLRVELSPESCVRPKVRFGSPVYEMEPPPSAEQATD